MKLELYVEEINAKEQTLSVLFLEASLNEFKKIIDFKKCAIIP